MTDELNDVQRRIETYLVEQVERGNQYFKSKYIAEDLDLSSKAVGTNLGMLQEKTEVIVIESWSGGSSGTTWRITHDEEDAGHLSSSDDDTPPVVSAAPSTD